MKQAVEAWLRRKFVAMHGEGAPHQADFYRCTVCARLTTWNMIRSANVCCEGHVVPAYPTKMEIVRLFLLPWTIGVKKPTEDAAENI